MLYHTKHLYFLIFCMNGLILAALSPLHSYFFIVTRETMDFLDLVFKRLLPSSGKLSWQANNSIQSDEVLNYIVQRLRPDHSKEFSEVLCFSICFYFLIHCISLPLFQSIFIYCAICSDILIGFTYIQHISL